MDKDRIARLPFCSHSVNHWRCEKQKRILRAIMSLYCKVWHSRCSFPMRFPLASSNDIAGNHVPLLQGLTLPMFFPDAFPIGIIQWYCRQSCPSTARFDTPDVLSRCVSHWHHPMILQAIMSLYCKAWHSRCSFPMRFPLASSNDIAGNHVPPWHSRCSFPCVSHWQHPMILQAIMSLYCKAWHSRCSFPMRFPLEKLRVAPLRQQAPVSFLFAGSLS